MPGSHVARVLLGWELGEGYGHLTRLVDVATALANRGWEPYLAVRDLRSLNQLNTTFRTLQAPVSPGVVKNAKIFKASGYSDILAAAGFGNLATLWPLVASWETLIELVDPDLIVADFSPFLCLAAYGTVPILCIGDGFVLPPSGTHAYPKLRVGNAELGSETDISEVVAECQRKRKRRAPVTLSSMTAGDRQILTVIEELDPYRRWRSLEARAPFSDRPSSIRGAVNSTGVFVYLSAASVVARKFLQALTELKIPVELFIRDADEVFFEKLKRPNWILHETLPPMAEILKRHGVVVHHGGIGTAQLALAHGRAQILLPRHFEQYLNAAQLRDLGVASIVQNTTSLFEIRARLQGILHDAWGTHARRAELFANEIAQRDYASLTELAADIAEMLASRGG